MRVLVASFDMEVGGVERSLIGMLQHLDYTRTHVDLFLHRHQGDFLPMLPNGPYLLSEVAANTTFRKSISQTIREGHIGLGLTRLLAKWHTARAADRQKVQESGYYQMQLIWKYALPLLPAMPKSYDAAISYLWPHDYVAYKVKAHRKIAWIHTDYSTIETLMVRDLEVWNRFDTIVAVSEASKLSFLSKYPSLEPKLQVMENILSPEIIHRMAQEEKPEEAFQRDSRFKLLTVARLSHAKGIDQAVLAMKQLCDQGYADRFVWYVVGYGGDEEGIRQQIRSLGLENNFVLLGKKLNPYPYMKACDLYVQPSRYEGKAVTVTEAQILHKPVLITRYTTSASQVQEGRDGMICEMGAEGIAAGIRGLYENEALRARLTQFLQESPQGNLQELEKLYSWIGVSR